MHGRVERLVERIERLDARARERSLELVAHEPDALQQRVVFSRPRERPIEVVERRQQLLHERPHAALARRSGVPSNPLAVVLEVGLGALSQREIVVALLGGLDQLVELALDLGSR